MTCGLPRRSRSQLSPSQVRGGQNIKRELGTPAPCVAMSIVVAPAAARGLHTRSAVQGSAVISTESQHCPFGATFKRSKIQRSTSLSTTVSACAHRNASCCALVSPQRLQLYSRPGAILSTAACLPTTSRNPRVPRLTLMPVGAACGPGQRVGHGRAFARAYGRVAPRQKTMRAFCACIRFSACQQRQRPLVSSRREKRL